MCLATTTRPYDPTLSSRTLGTSRSPPTTVDGDLESLNQHPPTPTRASPASQSFVLVSRPPSALEAFPIDREVPTVRPGFLNIGLKRPRQSSQSFWVRRHIVVRSADCTHSTPLAANAAFAAGLARKLMNALPACGDVELLIGAAA